MLRRCSPAGHFPRTIVIQQATTAPREAHFPKQAGRFLPDNRITRAPLEKGPAAGRGAVFVPRQSESTPAPRFRLGSASSDGRHSQTGAGHGGEERALARELAIARSHRADKRSQPGASFRDRSSFGAWTPVLLPQNRLLHPVKSASRSHPRSEQLGRLKEFRSAASSVRCAKLVANNAVERGKGARARGMAAVP